MTIERYDYKQAPHVPRINNVSPNPFCDRFNAVWDKVNSELKLIWSQELAESYVSAAEVAWVQNDLEAFRTCIYALNIITGEYMEDLALKIRNDAYKKGMKR